MWRGLILLVGTVLVDVALSDILIPVNQNQHGQYYMAHQLRHPTPQEQYNAELYARMHEQQLLQQYSQGYEDAEQYPNEGQVVGHPLVYHHVPVAPRHIPRRPFIPHMSPVPFGRHGIVGYAPAVGEPHIPLAVQHRFRRSTNDESNVGKASAIPNIANNDVMAAKSPVTQRSVTIDSEEPKVLATDDSKDKQLKTRQSKNDFDIVGNRLGLNPNSMFPGHHQYQPDERSDTSGFIGHDVRTNESNQQAKTITRPTSAIENSQLTPSMRNISPDHQAVTLQQKSHSPMQNVNGEIDNNRVQHNNNMLSLQLWPPSINEHEMSRSHPQPIPQAAPMEEKMQRQNDLIDVLRMTNDYSMSSMMAKNAMPQNQQYVENMPVLMSSFVTPPPHTQDVVVTRSAPLLNSENKILQNQQSEDMNRHSPVSHAHNTMDQGSAPMQAMLRNFPDPRPIKEDNLPTEHTQADAHKSGQQTHHKTGAQTTFSREAINHDPADEILGTRRLINTHSHIRKLPSPSESYVRPADPSCEWSYAAWPPMNTVYTSGFGNHVKLIPANVETQTTPIPNYQYTQYYSSGVPQAQYISLPQSYNYPLRYSSNYVTYPHYQTYAPMKYYSVPSYQQPACS